MNSWFVIQSNLSKNPETPEIPLHCANIKLCSVASLKQAIYFANSFRNSLPSFQTFEMFYVAVSENEPYLYSASSSNALAAQAATPEVGVVNSIRCMFIVVAQTYYGSLLLPLCVGGAVVCS